jgi:DNA-binding transcriptional regulator YhcF (GntR family)
LDPDDPRPPYLQVASALRAAILTGGFRPGEKLPSQKDLATRYGVSRLTLQQSLRILRDEGLIVSRQGSGVFVRERAERPVGLQSHLDVAFSQDEVQIDFAGYTAGHLETGLREPIEKIRTGRLTPKSIRLRVLLADLSRPMALPVRAKLQAGDDADVRAQIDRLSEPQARRVVDSLEELKNLGLVQKASVQIRRHGSAPLLMLYLLNNHELFLGLCKAGERNVRIDMKQVKIHEPSADAAVLVHHSADADPGSTGSLEVKEACEWFDNIWTTLGRPHVPA